MSASRSTSNPRILPSRSAASRSRCHWSRPWCTVMLPSLRDSVHLTGRPSLRAISTASTSSAVTCSLDPKPPPTSGAMTRMFCSGIPVTRASMTRSTCGIWVDGPEGELPAHARADHRARLHRARDQPLLAVRALDHHGRVAEGRVQVALGEDEVEALVARLVHLGRRVLQRRPHVEHRRKLLVVDFDGGQRVGRGVAVAGHDAGHGLADVAHLVHRHRRVRRDHDVRGDRPGAGQAALLGGEVRAGVGGDHPRLVPGRADVHRGDPGVRVRAAEERDVQHPGQRDVVGPVGLAGDEALVFLAQARLAELSGFRLGYLSLRGHSLTPACAARRTARTMFS